MEHLHTQLDMNSFLLITLVMVLATFIIRFSVICMAGSFEMPQRLKKTLRFVPVTVLPAIIAIEILGSGSDMEFNLHNPKVLAAIVCTLVSLRFNLIWVVMSGIVSLLLFKHFLC
ncbi:AzlD domain-containing protein [Shewanella psychropiezotolerans]|uniref:AzlD domain-containing protein n=1 Tax=Shewanella psychropiezotolerans TaxID=2593655 RepID=A0ABX5WZC7_9GAMM|nr:MULTISPECIES: AzlD domain-containing protein [Shewanella]MPY24256.1 AzlD domain-containing protein [Shewanella sp. YLB-07]QDO84461.1 AzlD domain-containing protein [Shewanella psychropiezotolerans]